MISLLKFLALAPLLVGPLAVLPNTNALSLSDSSSNALNARAHHAAISRRRNGEAGGFEKIARSGQDLAIKKQKKRSKHIKKRGGQVCRIKNDDGSFSVVSSSASASSPATSAAATTSTPAAASTTDTPPAATQAPTSQAWSSSQAAAPSSAAPPAVGGNPSGGGASGLGLAWPNGGWDCPGNACINNFAGSTSTWAYDWHYQTLQCAIDHGLEYVPMMWGAKDASQSFWDAAALWPSSVTHVLFFNEPNDGGQANIDPWASVAFWKQYMSPLAAKGYKIGMAATTSAPSGLKWVQDFKAACPECWDETSFVPLHYYDTDAERFQKYVEDYHTGYGGDKPVWVTEYACQNFNGGAQCSWDETMAFHYSMNDWFKQTPYVERWSPFGAMRNMQGVNQDNALMNPDGSITGLGNYYAYSG